MTTATRRPAVGTRRVRMSTSLARAMKVAQLVRLDPRLAADHYITASANGREQGLMFQSLHPIARRWCIVAEHRNSDSTVLYCGVGVTPWNGQPTEDAYRLRREYASEQAVAVAIERFLSMSQAEAEAFAKNEA